jgi:hypothetical protein
MVTLNKHVSDHFEIDNTDAYLRVKNTTETIDNRVLVDQILPLSRRFFYLEAWDAIYTLSYVKSRKLG